MTTKPILLVEDDDAVRQAIRDVLADEGYNVYCASNGRVALNLLSVIPRPCVILVDLMMPVMSGRELLAELREDDGFAAIPVTVITAARDLGGLGDLPVLKKPIQFLELLATVEELVGRADRPTGAWARPQHGEAGAGGGSRVPTEEPPARPVEARPTTDPPPDSA